MECRPHEGGLQEMEPWAKRFRYIAQWSGGVKHSTGNIASYIVITAYGATWVLIGEIGLRHRSEVSTFGPPARLRPCFTRLRLLTT